MEPDIFIITKLLSDPSRMHILDILMDGKAHTVNEIASFTKIQATYCQLSPQITYRSTGNHSTNPMDVFIIIL